MIRCNQASISSRGALVSLSSSLPCRRSLRARSDETSCLDRSQSDQSHATPRRSLVIRASYEPNKQERGQAQAKTAAPMQFNPIYAAICGEQSHQKSPSPCTRPSDSSSSCLQVDLQPYFCFRIPTSLPPSLSSSSSLRTLPPPPSTPLSSSFTTLGYF